MPWPPQHNDSPASASVAVSVPASGISDVASSVEGVSRPGPASAGSRDSGIGLSGSPSALGPSTDGDQEDRGKKIFSRPAVFSGPWAPEIGEQGPCPSKHKNPFIQPYPASSFDSSSLMTPAKRLTRTTRADRIVDSSPIKRARTGTAPPRHIDLSPSTSRGLTGTPRTNTSMQNAEPAQPEGPSSPLFFSRSTTSPRSRAQAGGLSADVAASMLSRISGDPPDSVTTLKLPRASVSSVSPARSGSTTGSWGSSLEVSAPSISPDTRSLPPALQALNAVGVIELVEQDERPTFLIDLTHPRTTSRPGLQILYHNASLRASQELLQLLGNEEADSGRNASHGQFESWIMSSPTGADGAHVALPSLDYGGMVWTCVTLRKRYRFVSANAGLVKSRTASSPSVDEDDTMVEPQDRVASPSKSVVPEADYIDPPDYFGGADPASASSHHGLIPEDTALGVRQDINQRHPDAFTNQVLESQPSRPTFDWTRIPATENLPHHIKFAKMIDWASTPLGPMEEWTPDLRAMSNLVMGSPHPACMFWGPEYVCIYNAAYIELAGQKHPSLMGMKYQDGWSEIWDEVAPVFNSAWESGQATMKHENHLFINRHGYLEETLFSWSIVPIVGGEGEVVGLYNPAFENTRRRVNERRMLTLREIGERTATATSVSGFWPQVQKALEYNEYDVPFALVYSVKEDAESDVSSLQSGSVTQVSMLTLEGSVGVPEGHPAAFATLDLRTSQQGFAPYIRQSITAPVVLSKDAGTLPTHLIQGLTWRGFGDPCTTIVVFPVVPTTTAEAVTGYVVMGVNPRRPYDDDYKLFMHLLSRQLATSMASVVLFEEEIKRGQRAARLAALDRQELSMQLVLRTQEANESEYKISKMAEFAPVGMFIADSQGIINYCNDMWWQISRHARSEESQNTWMDSVREEDRPALEAAWERLLVQRLTISLEFRFKCSQKSGDHTIDTWVLMSAFPEKTPEGDLKSIFGCITDISSQKWAERVQNSRREEAVELKRQQENFIDITSHEMRNPLSAILQCADQIADSISAFAAHADEKQVDNLLEACLDAANTINLCASHQKRIVDDILTLSKLDSKLLAVTPVDEQPVKVIQRTLKMFESELVAHEIDFEFVLDDSFERLGIQWVKLDPSRLRQVLINLMTNAIKFTQSREKRSIVVSLSASRDIGEVLNAENDTFYFDRNEHQRAPMTDPDTAGDWGDGELLNLHCSVEDTGPGLGDDERKLLFQRFQQASPRTHVQYGGSGLGLFISRILTELQGGQIGVSSRMGSGSKFSFYVQTRRSVNPPTDLEHIAPFKITRRSPTGSSQHQQDTTGRARASSSAAAMGHRGDPLDVLIVEDNIVNQRVLQRQLRSWGNNTFVANHGREALQTLQKSRFWAGHEGDGMDISVILMDLEMPVMDGVTCARKIRELEREGTIVRHIPIIAVTAYARPEQIENAKAAGIDDVISKPFRIPELMPKIEELVRRYRTLSVSPIS